MGPFYFSSIEIIIRACLKYAASGQSDLHFSIVPASFSGGEHSVVHAQTTSLVHTWVTSLVHATYLYHGRT